MSHKKKIIKLCDFKSIGSTSMIRCGKMNTEVKLDCTYLIHICIFRNWEFGDSEYGLGRHCCPELVTAPTILLGVPPLNLLNLLTISGVDMLRKCCIYYTKYPNRQHTVQS